MKKKLEADLISIAHRVLQLKNKSDINQLYLETQKLYEKLAVLRFVEDHFSEVKPTIGYSEITKEIESVFETPNLELESNIVVEEKATQEKAAVEEEKEEENAPLSTENSTEELSSIQQTEEAEIIEEELEEKTSEETTLETVEEKTEETIEENQIEINEEASETEEAPLIPAFELSQINEVETELEVPKKTEAVQISFEDLLGGNYHDTLFVKKQQFDSIPTPVVIDNPTPADEKKTAVLKTNTIEAEVAEQSEPKIVSLNDKLSKGINIDLNDRLAFIKHLFGNSSEDYNRVLSQLITFNTFYETRDFVQEMVKPDYNNWDGKQEYEDRFMDIIEKKFL